ncbi:MAG: transcriptional activator NhaR [Burkholderiaceae bacterium]
MNHNQLNYKHLLYFWVVAKEGSIAHAAERLDISSQTISGQIKRLEKSLGKSLFAPRGRGLVLTEAGRATLGYADQIFELGEELVHALASSEMDSTIRLHVGTTDALPKLVAYELLEPLFKQQSPVRLQCHEGEFDELLAELALSKLDVVLADRPTAENSGLRVFSHLIGECGMSMYATDALYEQFADGYPASLMNAPLLLPSRHTAIRTRLDLWLQTHGIGKKIIGEFEDSALLATFAATGLGIFPAVTVSAQDLASQYGVKPLGPIEGVREQVFAITSERRIKHPLTEQLLSNGRQLWQQSGEPQ